LRAHFVFVPAKLAPDARTRRARPLSKVDCAPHRSCLPKINAFTKERMFQQPSPPPRPGCQRSAYALRFMRCSFPSRSRNRGPSSEVCACGHPSMDRQKIFSPSSTQGPRKSTSPEPRRRTRSERPWCSRRSTTSRCAWCRSTARRGRSCPPSSSCRRQRVRPPLQAGTARSSGSRAGTSKPASAVSPCSPRTYSSAGRWPAQ